MTRTNTLLFVLFALALFAAIAPSPALAQTPDGQTPAVEEVCPREAGAAFGLCNAYCEAMDCHLANDEDPTTSPSASATACLKVQNRYLQFTGEMLSATQCGSDICPAGTENCFCGDEGFCESGLYCALEEDSTCRSEGGGEEGEGGGEGDVS